MRIHDPFTQLCLAEYAEVGVMMRDLEKNLPWTRMEAFHGANVFPKAKTVHKGERVVGRTLNIDVVHLFRGLYGAMVRKNEAVVSNDCDTDERHIKMPKGHTAMRNLLGIPLWADS